MTREGSRSICISPFVHDEAMHTLWENVSDELLLFGRREELRRLKPETLEGVRAFCISDLIVDGESLEEGEDGEGEQLEQNLHAMLYVVQGESSRNLWFLGSANATKAAFERNIEFILELQGTSATTQLDRLKEDLLGKDREGVSGTGRGIVLNPQRSCRSRACLRAVALSSSWFHLETGNGKVTIKRKRALDGLPFHERKGNTIREANALVGEFSEQIQCGEFSAFVRPKNGQRTRRVEILGSLCRKLVSGPSRQKCDRFIKHEITRKATPPIVPQRPPVCRGNIVILIAFDVASQELARVDENHEASPYR